MAGRSLFGAGGVEAGNADILGDVGEFLVDFSLVIGNGFLLVAESLDGVGGGLDIGHADRLGLYRTEN